jgi:hypothetical protein
MRSLRTALQPFRDTDTAPLGATKPRPLNREKLQQALAEVGRVNTRFFLVCVLMIVLLFAATVGVVLTSLDRPGVVQVALAAFGVSAAGLIRWMIALWREKNRTEVVLLLAVNMDDETLKTIVNLMAGSLK